MTVTRLYLGLAVHKDSITIALAEPGPKGEIRTFGTITHDLHALEKALSRIRKAHPGAHLEVAYEAGPCGFGIARRFKQLGVPCLVAAPSLIPKPPGALFKTDQRDARSITRLLRAGELTAVYVPEPTDEAIRGLLTTDESGAQVALLQSPIPPVVEFSYQRRHGNANQKTQTPCQHDAQNCQVVKRIGCGGQPSRTLWDASTEDDSRA